MVEPLHHPMTQLCYYVSGFKNPIGIPEHSARSTGHEVPLLSGVEWLQDEN